MKKTVAFIPARAGSTRIKNKNIAPINGYPMLEWSVRAAQCLDGVHEVYVSTDGEAIAELAANLGATVVMRKPELATSTATSESVIEDFLKTRGPSKPDIVLFMEVPQPFKDVPAINKALQIMKNGFVDSMFLGFPSNFFLWNERNESVTFDYKNRQRTQDMEKLLLECGDYLFTHESFMEHKCRLGGTIRHVETNRFAQMDVDEPEDLRLVQAIAKEFNLKPAGL